jgi:hypothetical protein
VSRERFQALKSPFARVRRQSVEIDFVKFRLLHAFVAQCRERFPRARARTFVEYRHARYRHGVSYRRAHAWDRVDVPPSSREEPTYIDARGDDERRGDDARRPRARDEAVRSRCARSRAVGRSRRRASCVTGEIRNVVLGER